MRCHLRQVEILRSAAIMLKPGGHMVFSTCTFNSTENENTVAVFLREHPDFSLRPIHVPGLPQADSGMLRLMPHRFRGEGHFVALLQKSEGDHTSALSSAIFSKPEKNAISAFSDFAKDMNCNIMLNAQIGSRLFLLPSDLPPLDGIRVLRTGLHIGEMRGRIFAPDHALALAEPMQKAFDIDEPQAFAYLHGDVLPCDESMRGYYTVRYRGFPMGFGKATGGQMKNHYPKGLRK